MEELAVEAHGMQTSATFSIHRPKGSNSSSPASALRARKLLLAHYPSPIETNFTRAAATRNSSTVAMAGKQAEEEGDRQRCPPTLKGADHGELVASSAVAPPSPV